MTQETATPQTDTPHAVVGEHSHSDTVTLPVLGTVTAPGGIYTVIFVALGILTLIEVLVAPILDSLDIVFLKVLVLMGMAVIKALLVVVFYMHLRQDSPIFRLILGMPVVMALLGMLYLISVPTGGGMGYLDVTSAAPPISGTFTPEAAVTSEAAAEDGEVVPAESTPADTDAETTAEPEATAES